MMAIIAAYSWPLNASHYSILTQPDVTSAHIQCSSHCVCIHGMSSHTYMSHASDNGSTTLEWLILLLDC